MGTAGEFDPPVPRVERATGITDGDGNIALDWPAGAFPAAPVVAVAVQADAGLYSARITANSATETTVNVVRAVGVTLLGIGVLAVGTNAAGVTVHVTATEA